MPRFRKFPRPLTPVVCNAVTALPDDMANLDDTPKWVQVATEGEYKGYAGGERSFTFNEQVFNAIVANFRKHPSYTRGGDGYGSTDVVAWDFHHASEMPANEGSVPSAGAPAQGWVRDLEARRGTSGKAELWALTNWLEPARTYIKEKRYRWASVSVVFDAVDPVSGETIGPVLTSIALTNQPFIEGMQPLAADKGAARAQLRRLFGMYLEPAESPEKAMEMIRSMLGLPETAGAVEVAAELEKVKQWVASGSAPLGVDVDAMVGGLRTILNLPSLSTADEVMLEADKLIARLQGDSGVGDEGAAPPAPEAPPPPPPPPASPAPEMNMSILNAIAEKLGVVAQDKAVLEALDQLTELRAIMASAAGLDNTASTKVICKAAASNEDVRAKYNPLLKALGVEDPDAALDKVAQLMTESEELKKAAPELATLRTKVADIEKVEEDEDVEAAMASMGIAKDAAHYEGIRLAMSHYRKGHSRDEFFERYPKAPAGKKHLTQSIAGKGADDATKVNATRTDGADGKDAIDISAYSGANLMLKACDFVRCTVNGADKWGWDKVHEHASALVRGKKVTASA